MTTDETPHDIEEGAEPPTGGDASTVELAAHDDERFLEEARPGRAARLRFAALLVLILLLHAAIIGAFLWRDKHDRTQVAQITETPVEIIQEPPPEPPKPPPPPEKKQPPPPKPKEDLSPALSAPRAPNEEKVETQKTQPKTSAPKAPTPPSEGQPQPKPQVAQPKEETPAQTKEDEARKEDKSKPDAEALDKAKPKVAKEPKTKQAKAAPKRKQKPVDVLAALSGSSALPEMSFAKPTPKTRIFGGTEDVRWMSEVEAALESKVSQLPRNSHWQAGGHVVIFFHVDVSGRVIAKEIVVKSGYPDIDALAMRALAAAAPFPPPPPGIEHGLEWSSVFDGQLPTLHIGKR